MKATQLLKQQHKEVTALLKKIKKAKGMKAKEKLFRQLATQLVSHDGIEREIFYPACEEKMGMIDLLGEALVEHGVIEFSLFELEKATEDDFDFKCTVLEEVIKHHVEEEEKEFFPKVEKKIPLSELKSLGEEMEIAFEEKLEEDYQIALHRNLKQVLQGALKTEANSKTHALNDHKLVESERRRAGSSA